MKIRTFFALEIPNSALQKIIDIRSKYFDEETLVKWESREKLHVTLKFLGDTDTKIIDSLINKFEKIIDNQNPFELAFDKFGFFKRNNVPNIFWVSLSDNLLLNSFVNETNILCEEFGYEREIRNFKPHITLLRIKNQNIMKEINNLCKEIIPHNVFIADKVIFFESILKSSGSIYKPIKSFIIK